MVSLTFSLGDLLIAIALKILQSVNQNKLLSSKFKLTRRYFKWRKGASRSSSLGEDLQSDNKFMKNMQLPGPYSFYILSGINIMAVLTFFAGVIVRFISTSSTPLRKMAAVLAGILTLLCIYGWFHIGQWINTSILSRRPLEDEEASNGDSGSEGDGESESSSEDEPESSPFEKKSWRKWT